MHVRRLWLWIGTLVRPDETLFVPFVRRNYSGSIAVCQITVLAAFAAQCDVVTRVAHRICLIQAGSPRVTPREIDRDLDILERRGERRELVNGSRYFFIETSLIVEAYGWCINR